MEKIKLHLDKKQKYIVACSFGPDSMALLDAAIKEDLNVIVAHVNYRKRDAAEFEQKSLEEYCAMHNIKIYVLDLLHKEPEGNFQDWARKQRYEFFGRTAINEGAAAVLVAHQQDDVIETYLMQKLRGNYAKNYGISAENTLFNVKIIRPLLDYTKAELKQYDDENGVPYSIDESNLTDHYTRNKIRHEIVEKLGLEERKTILAEIKSLENKNDIVKATYDAKDFIEFSYEKIIQILDFYMSATNTHRDFSRLHVEQIRKAFTTKTNMRIEVNDKLWIEKDYETIYFVNPLKLKTFNNAFCKTFKNEFINIDFSIGAEDRLLPKNKFNFVVKNVDKNDSIIIKDYSCSVRRLFIDWKMPLFLREIWPGIYDENGKLLYVPRYRKDFVDNHISVFEINTKYFTEF